ncbi:uncharacterized protein FOMMEDRAFT_140116 [Fomitiporia mediterranea MF3/22]|uniref:uncharacterized protein n=1 Tax=Fomitiporia mediterranea (strain MF3/22) TaxID=694068 RepID=UPI0004407B2F|nr:uncharacterized protein FOMMEDRAFT_140116 [Fomitiporia mediterranea MF3/22]EJD04037.1 hypothetical protein FOMMEDRAFT_140116 [Fomitiporia mediterranea MF3/22]
MEIEVDNDELDYESNTDVAAATDALSREQKPGHYTLINKLLGSLHVEHRLRRRAPSSESSTCTAGSTPPAPRHLQTPPKDAHLGTPQRPQEARSASSDENTIYKRFNEILGSLVRMRKQGRSSDQA